MMWTVAFMLTFAIGGMTGVLLAVPPADFVLHNSLFLVAHFHNVIIGGVLFGLFAGMTYWWPKAFGFRLDPFWGKVSFWCWVVGLLGGLHAALHPRPDGRDAADAGLRRSEPANLVPDRRPRRRADRRRHRGLPDPDRRLDPEARRAARHDGRPLGRPDPRVGDLLAAAGLQLRLHPGRPRPRRLVGHEEPRLRPPARGLPADPHAEEHRRRRASSPASRRSAAGDDLVHLVAGRARASSG